ncbi:MAG TPA: response regulator transcription factor [Anaerolineales bacterium]|nr:response regulator transcription factor [Anaerolineales bacterium]MCC6569114.1 response regulator transcription factor [Anaerolineales bacterium]HMR98008.1 response regulator transcription factor [Anaerolineales bacterium]HNQ94546.1 response regulator transcription factor [Anaerolineales bacterium]HNS62073.1 response regulator transcription factor [Anaerolineales bacterium]
MKQVRVLLADDHALFREGLAGIINSQPDLKVVGEANDGLEALVKARELKPDLILMDVQMPGMDGVEAARQIKQTLPETIIVMLTVRGEDEILFEALKHGAQGYLLKEIRSQDLLEMLRGAKRGEAALSPTLAGHVLAEFRRMSKYGAVYASDDGLTERELQVLIKVSQGATDKEIADALTISLNTVKTHIRNILSKLHVSTRREAARVAKTKGLM